MNGEEKVKTENIMNGQTAHFKQHTVDETACEMHLLNYYCPVSGSNPFHQRILRNLSKLSLVGLSALNSALLVLHDIITNNSQAH